MVENIAHVADATSVADRIAEALQAPFTLAEQDVFITTSIGIALSGVGFGQHTPGELLRDADAAMYNAKRKGKACYEIFDATTNAYAGERLKLEAALRQAIAQHEFTV